MQSNFSKSFYSSALRSHVATDHGGTMLATKCIGTKNKHRRLTCIIVDFIKEAL